MYWNPELKTYNMRIQTRPDLNRNNFRAIISFDNFRISWMRVVLKPKVSPGKKYTVKCYFQTPHNNNI